MEINLINRINNFSSRADIQSICEKPAPILQCHSKFHSFFYRNKSAHRSDILNILLRFGYMLEWSILYEVKRN